MSILQRFNANVDEYALGEQNTLNQRMYLLSIMQFGTAEKLKDVDFSSFSASDVIDVIEDLFEYQSDEGIDPEYDGECINLGNSLYEINALAGINKEIIKLKPKRDRIRRFF
ncbi:hypothetical protein EKG37_21245 [Robertmurraya yapensis]|uniref:Phage protein n=1 Tax=Bacillus yapensis TaxID=2492960 RepID=A0A431VTR0_9BACI|nr:hypothetical protein [Bacillus yapensis]RTR26597.1 hypothetical protein EKG37_21245 [Bacillus yapensis]TKS93772.1 hypothetical protein FAR12_21250 [Bacillus yapensis]